MARFGLLPVLGHAHLRQREKSKRKLTKPCRWQTNTVHSQRLYFNTKTFEKHRPVCRYDAEPELDMREMLTFDR